MTLIRVILNSANKLGPLPGYINNVNFNAGIIVIQEVNQINRKLLIFVITFIDLNNLF